MLNYDQALIRDPGSGYSLKLRRGWKDCLLTYIFPVPVATFFHFLRVRVRRRPSPFARANFVYEVELRILGQYRYLSNWFLFYKTFWKFFPNFTFRSTFYSPQHVGVCLRYLTKNFRAISISLEVIFLFKFRINDIFI